MADKSKIEWTDATWNPITGCSLASPGCAHCYAMKTAGRIAHLPQYKGLTDRSKAGFVWNGKVRLNEQVLYLPLRIRKRSRIFVNSMGDLFHEDVPEHWIDRVFEVMWEAHHKKGHVFQVLTKRAQRMRDYMVTCYVPNVWVGVSVENQEWANERLPYLVETPADIRFVSAEPLLGRVRLDEVWARMPSGGESLYNTLHKSDREGRVNWVIAGGESGPRSRPMHPVWALNLRDQCLNADVPFFFKQWGEWAPKSAIPLDKELPRKYVEHDFYDGSLVHRFGKKRAGRLLDGCEWNQMPMPPED